MPNPPDFIKLKDGVVDKIDDVLRRNGYPGTPLEDDGSFMLIWEGRPWPPPERLGLAVGRMTEIPMVFESKDLMEIDQEELAQSCHVAHYELVSFSEVPDEAKHDHVARGALYLPIPA